MRLWGWWRKDESTPADSGPKPAPSEPKTLDDLPPKFEDNVDEAIESKKRLRPSLRRILKSISLDDFKSMTQVPCFRSAMLTGMGMGAVAGSVILISRRSVPRAMNWMCGGFAAGSIVTWEQCRFRLHRGKQNVRQAQEVWRHKGEQSEHGERSKPASK